MGSHIVNSIIELHPDWRVTVLDLLPSRLWTPPREDVKYIQADVTQPEHVLESFQAARPNVVVHSAGIVPIGNDRYHPSHAKQKTFKVNVEGTRNIVQAAQRTGVKAMVFTSSITIVSDDFGHDYPNMNENIVPTPCGVYGLSKVAAEEIVLSANRPGFSTCAVRPSVILGPGDYQLLPTIHRCIAKGETPFVVGSGTNLFDFTYVTNIADAHVLAVKNLLGTQTAAGEAFFITNGEPLPFRDFCVAVWAEFGHVPPFTAYVPKGVAWWAGACAEWASCLTGTETTLSRGSVKDYCQAAYADISKARQILGYKPRVSLEDGIKSACKVRRPLVFDSHLLLLR